jgi:hypothetical protein
VLAPILGTQRRIDYIFNVKLLKIVIMNDVKVWSYVGRILAPQILLNILWSAISSPVAVLIVPDIHRPSLNYYSCPLDEVGRVFVGLCLAYFFLMICSVVYYAFKIRHVHDKFNEAKALTMTVYTLTLTWSVLIAVMFTIKDEVLSYYVRSLGVLLSFAMIQALLFFPKVVRILNERNGIPENTNGEETEIYSTTASPKISKHLKKSTSDEEKKNSTVGREMVSVTTSLAGFEGKLTTVLSDDQRPLASWRSILSDLRAEIHNLHESLLGTKSAPPQYSEVAIVSVPVPASPSGASAPNFANPVA